MNASTSTATMTAPTSYHSNSYIHRLPLPEEYSTSFPPSTYTTDDPITLPPLPALSNPVLATPHTNRRRRAQTTSPSHLPYTKASSPPRLSHTHSKASSAPRHCSTSPSHLPHTTLDHPSARAPFQPTEPNPAQALNDLHYLSSLTAAQRAELYRRSRLNPSSSSASFSSSEQGWLSYLPSLLNTLKSRFPSTSAAVHSTHTPSRIPSLPSTSLPSPTHILESYTALTHLLASERLENAKLKKACEALKRQVREVSARCCALEALGFGAGSAVEVGGKKGKGKRGVKRRREEDGEEGKRSSPSSRVSSPRSNASSVKSKRVPTTPPALGPSSTTNAKRSPAPKKKPIVPHKPVIEPSCAQFPIDALPQHARKHHPSYNLPSPPHLRSPISLAARESTTSSGSATSSTLTASATSSRGASRTSTPSSLGLSIKPLKYDDEDISDVESLPTPSYLPIPFLSQQARNLAVPEVKSLYTSPAASHGTLEGMSNRDVRTAPATPEGKSSNLECPPTPPKRVKSASGRMQSGVRSRVRGKNVISHASNTSAVGYLSPEATFEITPSPSPATNAEEGDDEGREEERKRERDLLALMFVNTGREVECRACRINTTYPATHAKYLPSSLVQRFIVGTTEQEFFAHLLSNHATEWDEMKRLSGREVGLLKARLGVRGWESCADGVKDGERVGYRDLRTGEFVHVDPEVDEMEKRTGERTDEVPEVRLRVVPVTKSLVMMRMAGEKALREGNLKGMVCVGA